MTTKTREAAIKAKQDGERKATRPRAKQSADPMTRELSAVKAMKAAPSKAERVRALLEKGKTVREVADALDDVTWSYAWDVAAAWEKKTGKVVIPSHAKPKTTRSRRSRSSGMPRDAAQQDAYPVAPQEGTSR